MEVQLSAPTTPQPEVPDSGVSLGEGTDFFSFVDNVKKKTPVQRPNAGRISGHGKLDQQVFSTWKADPSPKNGSALLANIQGDIDRAVQSHTGGLSPVDRSAGRILAMRAMQKYDGRSSVGTYLNSQLLPLKRAAAARGVGVNIPRSVPQDKHRLQVANENLLDRLGREPSLAELSEYSGLPLSRINQLSKINLPVTAESEMGDDGEATVTAGDQAVDTPDLTWQKTVYFGLSPRDQFIMQHTTGLYGAKILSNQDIAKRLKVSPAAISQRKAIIQKALDR